MNFSHRLPAALIGATITVVQPQFAVAQLSPQQVEAIGREITVRIDGGGGGSGVIIDRKDNTYFVLTNHHVVRYPDRYEIVTSDGSRYPVYKMQELPGFDLALIQFQSNKIYRVAEFGNSDGLTGGANVYASGFPMPQPGREQRDYRFSPGEFQRYQPAGDNGYTMVYNSEVIPGMSGGPVLDRIGRIVGINGRSCSGLRLGIPINSFLANQRNLRQLQDSSADNTRPEDFLSLGGKNAEKGDYESAIRDYQRALQSCPDSPDIYLLIAKAQYDVGNKQAAIENYNQVIRINPNSSAAYNNRGLVRYGLEDKQGAIGDFNEAIRLNPNDAIAYVARGLARSGLGDSQGAIADLNEAIRLNPNFANTYGIRGLVRYGLEDKQGAIGDFNEAIRLNPKYANAYVGRGLARSGLGDSQGAIADLNEAI
ncbi:tetratricopeptide repeat-containing serine protease family protein, partial [Microcoleus sp. CAWBG50]